MTWSRPSDNRARRWRQFCRGGWRMAWGFALVWFGAMTLLFRVAPTPAPLPHETPTPLSWWPTAAGGAATGGNRLDVRAVWTPSAFALSSPAGFSHSQRRERAHLTPPVQVSRPRTALSEHPRSAAAFDLLKPERIRLASSDGQPEWRSSSPVFSPRVQEPESPRLTFSDGWESRLFSGIDLNYGSWSDAAWTAQVEIQFDDKGIPTSVLLAHSSGLPEVDRQLARSISGWRLLEPAAPRTGLIAWNSPRMRPVLSVEESVASSGEGDSP